MRFSKNILAVAALSALVMTACSKDVVTPPSAEQEEVSIKDGAKKGELLVKFNSDVAEILEKALPTKSGIPNVDEIFEIAGAYEFERVFPADPRHEDKTREAGLHLWYIVRFDESVDIEVVGRQLAALGSVQGVEPNHGLKRAYNEEKKAIPALNLAATKAAGIKDPLFKYQWNLYNDGTLWNRGFTAGADVNVVPAWEKTTGDPSIVVAILDEGIYYNHPDLLSSMWVNEGEIFGSEVDNDGNGYAGDYFGYNFVTESGVISYNLSHDSGHGSHVAGIVAARNGNGVGINSIAGGNSDGPGVKIMACQIFSGNSLATVLAEVRAIKYAADNGAQILQCSWGYISSAANPYDWAPMYPDDESWMTDCPIEKEALFYFEHTAGSPNGPVEGGIIVYASGNESAAASSYPGAYGDFVSVIGTAPDFTPAVYTNYGPGCDICAPGGDQDYFYDYYDEAVKEYGTVGCILSTVPYTISPSGYAYFEGTSMATPHISSTFALAASYAAKKHLHLKAEDYRRLLVETATPLDDLMYGTKEYRKYVVELGNTQPRRMSLDSYRGKMAAGQVNVEAFLKAVEGAGSPLSFPNVYVGKGKTVTVDAHLYFDSLAGLSVSVDDASVVSTSVSNGKVQFIGVKEGTTKATVTAGSQRYTVSVIVRGNGSQGWM